MHRVLAVGRDLRIPPGEYRFWHPRELVHLYDGGFDLRDLEELAVQHGGVVACVGRRQKLVLVVLRVDSPWQELTYPGGTYAMLSFEQLGASGVPPRFVVLLRDPGHRHAISTEMIVERDHVWASEHWQLQRDPQRTPPHFREWAWAWSPTFLSVSISITMPWTRVQLRDWLAGFEPLPYVVDDPRPWVETKHTIETRDRNLMITHAWNPDPAKRDADTAILLCLADAHPDLVWDVICEDWGTICATGDTGESLIAHLDASTDHAALKAHYEHVMRPHTCDLRGATSAEEVLARASAFANETDARDITVLVDPALKLEASWFFNHVTTRRHIRWHFSSR